MPHLNLHMSRVDGILGGWVGRSKVNVSKRVAGRNSKKKVSSKNSDSTKQLDLCKMMCTAGRGSLLKWLCSPVWVGRSLDHTRSIRYACKRLLTQPEDHEIKAFFPLPTM